MKGILLMLAGLVVLGIAGGAAFVNSGLYDISATDQHLRPTYHIIRRAMERSIARRAANIAVPPLGDGAQLARGAALFRAHCVQCHGAPGVAPEPFALALRPLATPLARSGRDRTPGQLYWVIRHGIKMTAMPAWEFRMSDEDIWATVAFVLHLPKLAPAEYRALPRAPVMARPDEPATGPPDVDRGRRALDQYGCIACHEMPGMVGPEARLGPTLHGIARRQTLGGVLPNTPENMARWIRDPQSHAPGSAMPSLRVTERDARDMAAILATFR